MCQTAMEFLQQLIVIQNQFVGQDLINFMRENIDIPVIIVTLYLALVLYVPNAIMKDRKPIPCKAFFTLWNLILTIFSAIGSYYTVPHLVNMVWTQGIRQSACNATYFFDGPVGFWMGMFALSKVPELMDTVFLVIQKKDIIFLHWFHHATVMLFCWSAYSNRVAAGLWFAAMNFIVHSIMYFYYFLTACGARAIVRPFAPLITSLQLLQMVVGMVVTVATFVWRRDEEGCSVDPANSRLGLIMYATYFVLFAMLFKKSYLTPGGRKGRSPKTDTVDAKTK